MAGLVRGRLAREALHEVGQDAQRLARLVALQLALGRKQHEVGLARDTAPGRVGAAGIGRAAQPVTRLRGGLWRAGKRDGDDESGSEAGSSPEHARRTSTAVDANPHWHDPA